MEELDKDLKELRAENQQKMEQLRRYSDTANPLLLFGLVSAMESTLTNLLPLPQFGGAVSRGQVAAYTVTYSTRPGKVCAVLWRIIHGPGLLVAYFVCLLSPVGSLESDR